MNTPTKTIAATAPSLELTVEGATLTLHYRNLKTCQVSYYPMDLELMFSRNPFVRDDQSGRFSLVKPARVEDIALPAGKDALEIKLPAEFANRNLLVRGAKTGKAMGAVYVKVYARRDDGSAVFYKDGYTDLRGRFDYASLSTDDLDHVQKFAVLVMSDDTGAVVREVDPPRK